MYTTSRKNTRKCLACSSRNFSSLPRLDCLFVQQIYKWTDHSACRNKYNAPPTMSQSLRCNQFASECVNVEAIKPPSNRFTTKPISNQFRSRVWTGCLFPRPHFWLYWMCGEWHTVKRLNFPGLYISRKLFSSNTHTSIIKMYRPRPTHETLAPG